MNYKTIESTSEDEFVQKGVNVLREKIDEALARLNSCIIGLSGGSTPKKIYEELGKQDIDWSKAFVFLVDERYIEASNSDSNQYLVRSTLLKNAIIPEKNLVFPDTSLPIDECISKYAKDLIQLFNDHLPTLVTLGIGEDGHIASLLPPSHPLF